MSNPERFTSISATLMANHIAERKRHEGINVLPLGFGEAGLPVHPELRRQLAAAAGHNAYGDVAGSPALRAAAAGYWNRRSLHTDPELVVCGPGSKPLLFALLMILGGDVALPRPSWVSYAAQTRMTLAHPVFVPILPDQGGVPDPEALANAATAARAAGRALRVVVVTIPDNPTGTVARPDTIRRLCAVAQDHDLTIISDEIYRDLTHDPTTPVPSPAAVAPERTIVTTGLSKSLALGGWRIGIARLPHGPSGERLRAQLLSCASEIWTSPSAPIQQAAAYALGEPPELAEHVERSRRLHATVANAVAQLFRAAGAVVPAPQAAFYLYPDLEFLREHLVQRHNVRAGADLSLLLLERYAMGVLPASCFGEAPEALRLRIATSLLYGSTSDERTTALTAADPLTLPWIATNLAQIRDTLQNLTRSIPVAASTFAPSKVGSAPPAQRQRRTG